MAMWQPNVYLPGQYWGWSVWGQFLTTRDRMHGYVMGQPIVLGGLRPACPFRSESFSSTTPAGFGGSAARSAWVSVDRYASSFQARTMSGAFIFVSFSTS